MSRGGIRLFLSPMGRSLYRTLGDDPDTELAWRLVREHLGRTLFGDAYVTVPYLEYAVFFNQMFAFVKVRKMMHTLGLRGPTYKIIGNLDTLCDHKRSQWIPEFDFSSWDVIDCNTFNGDFRYRVRSENQDVLKSVDVIIQRSHARVSPAPEIGSAILNTAVASELRQAKKIYVITEVVFASYVLFRVRIRDRVSFVVYNRDVPVAMKYRKYELGVDGLIVNELQTNMKFNDTQCKWLKPSIQIYPRAWSIRQKMKKAADDKHRNSRRNPRNPFTVLTPPTNERNGSDIISALERGSSAAMGHLFPANVAQVQPIPVNEAQEQNNEQQNRDERHETTRWLPTAHNPLIPEIVVSREQSMFGHDDDDSDDDDDDQNSGGYQRLVQEDPVVLLNVSPVNSQEFFS